VREGIGHVAYLEKECIRQMKKHGEKTAPENHECVKNHKDIMCE
jgi:hypothetical protein